MGRLLERSKSSLDWARTEARFPRKETSSHSYNRARTYLTCNKTYLKFDKGSETEAITNAHLNGTPRETKSKRIDKTGQNQAMMDSRAVHVILSAYEIPKLNRIKRKSRMQVVCRRGRDSPHICECPAIHSHVGNARGTKSNSKGTHKQGHRILLRYWAYELNIHVVQ